MSGLGATVSVAILDDLRIILLSLSGECFWGFVARYFTAHSQSEQAVNCPLSVVSCPSFKSNLATELIAFSNGQLTTDNGLPRYAKLAAHETSHRF